MVFDEAGVCMGCRVHEEKDSLDWSVRLEKLKDLVKENLSGITGNNFDCIVPVTGGGDSFFTVHVVKNILGLNPLLVNYNSHFNTRVGIRNLANLQTVFDCEMITSTLSPSLLKRITRATLKKFGSMYWQVLAGNSVFPVQMAVKFRTPLIIWGVHGWSEQTGMFSHLDEAEMTARCRKEHCLMGFDANSLINASEGITHHDIKPWLYPDDHELEKTGVRGIYLSNYIRWDSKAQHELMIDLYGYETAAQLRTFNTYEDVHCVHSAGLHDYLKFLKYGYGKVTDHASREIRLKRMSREQGVALVSEYSKIKPSDLDDFLNWIEMKESEFWALADRWRDPRVWVKNTGQYELLGNLNYQLNSDDVNSVRLDSSDDCIFKLTGSQEPNERMSGYLLMGRGYVDEFNFGAVEPEPEGGRLLPRKWVEPNLDLGDEYEIL
jgi:N-acetyl sugar amidotransferase